MNVADIERLFGKRGISDLVLAPELPVEHPAPALGPNLPVRANEVCRCCGGTFEWFYVADGACVGCWAKGGR